MTIAYLKETASHIRREEGGRQKMKIGVLAIQGAVSEHITMVKKTMDECGIDGTTYYVKENEDIRNVEKSPYADFCEPNVPFIRFSDSMEAAELIRTQKSVRLNVDDIWTNNSKENYVSFITETLSGRKSL